MSSSSEEEFEVEKILSKKTEKRKVYYRIKWEGYGTDQSTWELRDDLIADGLGKEIKKWEAANAEAPKTKSKSTPRRRRASKTPPRSTNRQSRSKTPDTKSKKETPKITTKADEGNSGTTIAFTAQSMNEFPLIWACFFLAALTAFIALRNKDLWQLKPVPAVLALLAVWCGYGTREHYSKFLAVSLVWHTAAELLLAMTDANAETNSKDWALVACIISHLALAYGNKQPSKSSDSSLGLAGSVLLCLSDIMLVLDSLQTDPQSEDVFLKDTRFLMAALAVVVLAFSAMTN